MNEINIVVKNRFKDINWRSVLDRLSAAMMLPLSLIAFSCIFLGIAYTLPSDWTTAKITKEFIGYMFMAFPFLVFFSVVNVFINEQNDRTLITSLIFLFTIYSMFYTVNNFFNIESAFSLFTSLICALVFITIYKKYNVYSFAWVGIGAILFLGLWPIFLFVDWSIKILGNVINVMPFGLNAFFYGFFNRLLIPVGLHSVMIPTFAWSPIGGYANIYNDVGEFVGTINGDSPIWLAMYTNDIKDFATIGNVEIDGIEYSYHVYNNDVIGQYQQGFLPITAFTFPMVALVYCYVNGFDKGKLFLTGAILTAFSGITETTEFNFILLNPWMYLLNAVMIGLSFMLCNLLNVNTWLSTGWSIDIILFGFIPWLKGFQTGWYWIPVIGITIGAIYSALFIMLDHMYQVIGNDGKNI